MPEPPDHPHVRGEKHRIVHSSLTFFGSSPRAWGKGRFRQWGRGVPRIIPTCVGKSAAPAPARSAHPDHPHVRGEKYSPTGRAQKSVGSSPRAWGKVALKDECCPNQRIIPTCVGKRGGAVAVILRAPDHPHVRGEKLRAIRNVLETVGSSPRAWGKDFFTAPPDTQTRIIPTCVGKRSVFPMPCFCSPDHPHVRGEKAKSPSAAISLAGSSPRAWGKDTRRMQKVGGRRIIPTCVGKSAQKCHQSTSTADHPHVRGEKGRGGYTHTSIRGSSPRAWGKGWVAAELDNDGRIIPTCVGKSPKPFRPAV